LQGSTAAELRKRHPEIPNDVDTVVYVEVAGGTERVYLRSAAILRICAVIGFESWSLRWLRRLPRWCADLGYRIFVRVRYRVFGKLDVCRVPSQEDAGRFLP
jgi:predicted DCC family thiol-disulfide oxidoreductase YuxK